jgi:hypothetical protein
MPIVSLIHAAMLAEPWLPTWKGEGLRATMAVSGSDKGALSRGYMLGGSDL